MKTVAELHGAVLSRLRGCSVGRHTVGGGQGPAIVGVEAVDGGEHHVGQQRLLC